MKKLILGLVLSLFGVSAAQACDGMKGHEKSSDKGDQASPQADKAGSKAAPAPDTKSDSVKDTKSRS